MCKGFLMTKISFEGEDCICDLYKGHESVARYVGDELVARHTDVESVTQYEGDELVARHTDGESVTRYEGDELVARHTDGESVARYEGDELAAWYTKVMSSIFGEVMMNSCPSSWDQ